MSKLSLRSRLFLSHLVVMGVGIVTLAGVGRFYSPRIFVVTLERIETYSFSVRQVKTQLIRGFELAWTRGMIWSVLLGGSAAGGLSYWVSRRIIRPLDQMEEVTRQFASGQFSERVPDSDIPEIQRLALSFNRMAADLEDVEQHRRELVGDLTHELRTPLTIVKGYLEGLADETVAHSADLYQRLAHEMSRLQRLVNDLQELSRLEAGYLPVQLQPVHLGPLLENLVQRFSDQLTEDDPLKFELICPAALPAVKADPERVEQILVNLLGNAFRYTEQGTITVSAYSEPGKMWVAVRDTGVGIAAEDLPYVFERFWRADRSRDRTSGGTGVGLTICRRLVEIQGGQIEVESQPGQGSEFRFWLPPV
ncbi:MAG: HAMP domain-containing histidine kinase [Cyanobacteria bacterium Co-bin8]|nr:HAMP domain-containing histidine kinase [Cyanobacteria bacterium Co-bin8]